MQTFLCALSCSFHQPSAPPQPRFTPKRLRGSIGAGLVTGLLLLAWPAATRAQYVWTTNDDGTISITAYTGPGGAVSIRSTIGGQPVTRIGKRAFAERTDLTSVTIPSGVTEIGEGAFFDCAGLPSVTIPGSVTSIGVIAFFGCTGLRSVTIANGVTEIGGSAFDGCIGLTSVRIPYSVTALGFGAFVGCTGLTNFIVDPLNPAYSAPDGVLFDRDHGTLIAYPGSRPGSYAVPGGVTGIEDYAFYLCRALTSITIPQNVADIGSNAFIGCTRLTNFNVAPFNLAYSSLDGVLFDNVQETLLVYPGGKPGTYFVPSSVSQIGANAFYGCGSLTSLTIPSSVTMIDLFRWKVTTFYGCASLTNFTVDPFNTNYSSLDGVLFNKSKDALIACPGGKRGGYLVPNSVTAIQPVAFAGCAGLTNIMMDKSVTSIGTGAFVGCTRLVGIYFSGNAPDAHDSVFGDDNLTIYYFPATTGWGSTFAGRPAVPWNPRIQAGDANFGMRSNGFGFNITGAPNIPVVVEASTSLASRAWVPLRMFTLTNGLVSFSDTEWTNYPGRFYRVVAPESFLPMSIDNQ